VRRRRAGVGLATLVAAAVAWGVTAHGDQPAEAPRATTPSTTTTATAAAPSTGAATARPTASPSSMAVPPTGSGRLVTVAGEVAAPGPGRVTTVRVRVEEGVDVVPQEFAAHVLATLNDPRSWGHGGVRTFARTSRPADVEVVLASPATSERLCRPLRTFGRLSCGNGHRAVLTAYRWAKGTDEFPDLALYRQYVVNHEVGHVLGHGHERCGGAGRLAPVMQQQTKRVAPCRPNAWPYP
jgi:hypothetical protein